MKTDWTVDGRIRLTAVAESADWHRLTVIDKLLKGGLERTDADAFANFILLSTAECVM